MILFFGFYFVFFGLLIYYIRSAKSEVKVPPVKEEDIMYKTEWIENNNYQYFYYIEDGNDSYTFQGFRDDENYDLSEIISAI